jgi:hypothetical protein
MKNYLYWIPILWNNWNFDADFHLILSIHKLKQMDKFFRRDAQVLSKYESTYYLRRAIYYGEKALNEWDDYELKQKYLNEYYDTLKLKHISIWD